MESNFLYFTYFLGLFVLYYGFAGFTRVSQSVFSDNVYKQITKSPSVYPLSVATGFTTNLLLGRFQIVQAYIQGAMYLGHISWKKAFGLLMGVGFSTTAYFLIISQMLKMQWLFPSVVIALFGFLALFVFRSDLFRLHGQRLFYLGILLIGFAWMNNVHQYWSQDMGIEYVWFWINQHVFMVFFLSMAISIILQTSFITGVIALSLLYLDMISFDASLSLFLGGYVGTPMGTLLRLYQLPKKAVLLQALFAVVRFVVTGLSLIWIPWVAKSPFMIILSPVEMLVLMFFIIQILQSFLYWPFHQRIFQSLSTVIEEKNPADLHRLFTHTPTLCFEVVSVYILQMAEKVRTMMELLCEPFVEDSRTTMIRIDEQFDQIEQMARKINFYLSKMNMEEFNYTESQRETHWFQISHALKNISSFINRNIMEIASQKKERGIVFQDPLWDRLKQCHQMLLSNFDQMVDNLQDEKQDTLKSILRNQKQIHSLKEEIKQSCLAHFRKDEHHSVEACSVFLSLLSQLQFLNISISRLAYPTIDRRRNR